MLKGEKETHPCYGKIRVSKFTGDSNFFGSNVSHSGGIMIEISRASCERSLSTDWIHSKNTIVEVKLSPLQFAELITTSMNTDGVPCTIRRDHKSFIEEADFTDTVEQFKDEHNARLDNSTKELGEALSLIDDCLAGKSIKKSDLKVIRENIRGARQQIVSNLDFVKDCFREHIQKNILEAKTAVEHFIQSKVTALGLKSMKDLSSKILNEGEN